MQIATKIEVFVAAGASDAEAAAAPFKRLGYLSFDSNEKSNHQARELKSVHVNVSAFLVKFVIHRCHVNKLNIYNQVSLWCVDCLWQPGGRGRRRRREQLRAGDAVVSSSRRYQ